MTATAIEDLPIVAADDTPAWDDVTRELGVPFRDAAEEAAE